MTKQKEQSEIIKSFLNSASPAQKKAIVSKMMIAAQITGALKSANKNSIQLAVALDGYNEDDVDKWLSGTHNFTVDELADITTVLNFQIIF